VGPVRDAGRSAAKHMTVMRCGADPMGSRQAAEARRSARTKVDEVIASEDEKGAPAVAGGLAAALEGWAARVENIRQSAVD